MVKSFVCVCVCASVFVCTLACTCLCPCVPLYVCVCFFVCVLAFKGREKKNMELGEEGHGEDLVGVGEQKNGD